MTKHFTSYILFVLFLSAITFGNVSISFGQTLQGEVVDTIQEKSVVIIHSPKKATIYSAVLPGLGQAYNKKYWKIPIIYAGFGALVYALTWNNKQYNRFKTAYKDYPSDEFEGLISETQLLAYVSSYRRDRDFAVVGMAALWGLNIIDANVDAHFFTYDISKDISLRTEPTFNCYPFAYSSVGVKLSLSF